MPTLEGPEGFCSTTGGYWNGTAYIPCGLERYCCQNVCGWETTPLPAGVTEPASTVAAAQGTGMAAGADVSASSSQSTSSNGETIVASTQTSDSTTTTDASGSAFQSASSSTSNVAESSSLDVSVGDKAVQPSGTAIQAGADKPVTSSSSATGAVQSASGSTSAQTASETGTGSEAPVDLACVDDRPNEHVNITKSPLDKWVMTGPKCEPRDSSSTAPRFVAYWNQWSDGFTLPTADQLTGVTHLILSFAGSDYHPGDPQKPQEIDWVEQGLEKPENPFNQTDKVDELKKLNSGMKVLAAFGGWNLDAGFSKAANTSDMKPLAQKIVNFKQKFNLDGIDIDWEYPVGGGAFYKACAATTEDKKLPERPYERDALADLLRHIRALDPDTHLSIAVPAKKVDRELSFPKETIEEINTCVDDWNLMTYDMMNRRDLKTTHHAGSGVIKDVVDYYHTNGIEDKKKINIGFSLYAKFFTLSNSTSVECNSEGGLGRDIYPAEGLAGQDLGTSGAWRFNLAQNEPSTNVAMDYTNKLAAPSWESMPDESTTHNATAGASSWADVKNRMFWTWTSPKDIEQSCANHMKDIGGVMVWSINQDTNGASGGPHMALIAGCLGGQ